MYNEQIEGLIKAALADGELTEKEKQILFKRAEAMGIDLDEFEMVLDARLVEQKEQRAAAAREHELAMAKAQAQPTQAAPKSSKYGDMRKCPSCGSPVQAFTTKCPECGFEFNNVEAVASAQKLFELLQEADLRKSEKISLHNKEKNKRLEELSKKHNSDGSLVKIFGGESRKQAQDEEREDLIRELNRNLNKLEKACDQEKYLIIKNFPVPNSKEDLLELLAMATSNAYDNDGVVGEQETVWIQKVDQIYQKVVASSAGDENFLIQATNMVASLMKRLPSRYKKFTVLPENMRKRVMEEMEAQKSESREKKMGLIKKYGIPAAGGIVLGFLFVATNSSFFQFIGLVALGVGFVSVILLIKGWNNINNNPLA